MAVAPASMADQIIVLDGDDEEDSPRPCCSASTSSFQHQATNVLTLKPKQPIPTHITTSPFASAKKDTHVLQAENNRLFTEFVEHCSALTQDCPEVLTYLQARHSKASSDYLSSVAFRNTLGSCLTRAQVNRSKTFVYINELCTVLRQHSAKRRQITDKVHSVPCTSTSSSLPSTWETEVKVEVYADKSSLNPATEDKQPSNSEQQEDGKDRKENLEVEKTANRASRKQMAYLENLLKVYNDEIQRLQQAELSLDDLGCDESSYIQENKLKRKMMKIYEKLCELKGCSALTGRVIEGRISFTGTRYPEINKRVERFINSPDAHRNPPDFQDIHHVVVRANERYNLCLSRKRLNQIAKEAFRDVATSVQNRRHQDLLYNFGSYLTDDYKPALDPALLDPSLRRKLKSNREVALSRLEEVIKKYAVKQEDTEEQERTKRQEKNSKEKEGHKSKKEEEENKKMNGVAEEEEEEDEEEDESSDPDIEEELQASAQQDGPDDEENEGDGSDQAEQQADGATNRTDQTDELSGGISALGEEDVKNEVEEPITNGLSPWSDDSKSQISPQSDLPSSTHSPNQSEPPETDNPPLSNGSLAGVGEPVGSPSHVSAMNASDGNVSPTAARSGPSPLSPVITDEKHDTQTTTNGTSAPSCPRTLRSRKRKREEMTSGTPRDAKHTISDESETDVPLHMGVVTCQLPQEAESTRANTPTQEQVSSSRTTPPPKKNKVDVATQCDPDVVIVLSD